MHRICTSVAQGFETWKRSNSNNLTNALRGCLMVTQRKNVTLWNEDVLPACTPNRNWHLLLPFLTLSHNAENSPCGRGLLLQREHRELVLEERGTKSQLFSKIIGIVQYFADHTEGQQNLQRIWNKDNSIIEVWFFKNKCVSSSIRIIIV